MNWCRIENNVVMEIHVFDRDPNGVFYHPSLIWVSDPTGLAQVGYIYDPTTQTFAA